MRRLKRRYSSAPLERHCVYREADTQSTRLVLDGIRAADKNGSCAEHGTHGVAGYEGPGGPSQPQSEGNRALPGGTRFPSQVACQALEFRLAILEGDGSFVSGMGLTPVRITRGSCVSPVFVPMLGP